MRLSHMRLQIQFNSSSIQFKLRAKAKAKAMLRDLEKGRKIVSCVVSKNVMKNEQKFKVLNSAIQSAPAFAFSRAMAWSLMISPRTVSVISL